MSYEQSVSFGTNTIGIKSVFIVFGMITILKRVDKNSVLSALYMYRGNNTEFLSTRLRGAIIPNTIKTNLIPIVFVPKLTRCSWRL